MSAAWTPGRVRDQVRGVLAADPDASGPCWLLCWSLVVRWFGAGFGPSRPTARGWGCTGHGVCVLHQPPHLVQCPRGSGPGVVDLRQAAGGQVQDEAAHGVGARNER